MLWLHGLIMCVLTLGLLNCYYNHLEVKEMGKINLVKLISQPILTHSFKAHIRFH